MLAREVPGNSDNSVMVRQDMGRAAAQHCGSGPGWYG